MSQKSITVLQASVKSSVSDFEPPFPPSHPQVLRPVVWPDFNPLWSEIPGHSLRGYWLEKTRRYNSRNAAHTLLEASTHLQ